MSNVELPIETDVAAVAEMRRRGEEFLLLDVREQHEYDFARIDGSLLIPMAQLRDRIDELDKHRESRIVVYCHHGVRSGQVTAALRNRGFPRVQNMAGGIDRWSEQIDPSVPRY